MIQTLVTAVQNAAPAHMVGTVTSANNFLWEIGATLGIAVVRSVFAGALTSRLTATLPAGSGRVVGDSHSLTPAVVHALPSGLREIVVDAYASSLAPVFGDLVPAFVLALLLALLLEDEQIPEDAGVEGST